MRIVLKPLPESVLICHSSGTTVLIASKEEMVDIMKIVKFLEESG